MPCLAVVENAGLKEEVRIEYNRAHYIISNTREGQMLKKTCQEYIHHLLRLSLFIIKPQTCLSL